MVAGGRSGIVSRRTSWNTARDEAQMESNRAVRGGCGGDPGRGIAGRRRRLPGVVRAFPGGQEDGLEGVSAAHHVVAVGFGQVLEASSKPVAAVPGQQAFPGRRVPGRRRRCRGRSRPRSPGLRDGALADDAEHLRTLPNGSVAGGSVRASMRRRSMRPWPFAGPASWQRTVGSSQSRPWRAAVRRPRRHVRVLGEPRRDPSAQRRLQGVRIGVGHRPADGRRRPRRPPVRDAPPRAQRAQLLSGSGCG